MQLKERQVKAFLFAKEKRKITNSDYQILNGVSKATATRDLAELVELYKIFNRSGEVGAGTNYVLIGSIGSYELHILHKRSTLKPIHICNSQSENTL